MLKRIYINNDWYFIGNDNIRKIVFIPHNIKEIPYNYFDQKIYQFTAVYEKETIYSIEAIKGGEVVSRINLGDAKQLHLDIQVSNNTLHEETSYDAAAIRLRVLDQNNNLAQYYQEAFTVKVEGPIEVIGPKLLSFKGGMLGTYIKTTHTTGNAKVIIETPFETKEIDFQII